MKSRDLTLEEISRHILAELLRARTDFLLSQTALWNKLNDRARLADQWVRPESLDLTGSNIDFHIRRKWDSFLVRFWKIITGNNNETGSYRMCRAGDRGAIRVSIAVKMQGDSMIKPEITTVPDTGLKAGEIHVADFS